MVETQCETNCECMEIQRTSTHNNIQMNVLVVKLPQIKQIVVVVNVVVVILFLKQNHFRKILLDCTYRGTCGKIEKADRKRVGYYN
jgi:hypothetical protein